MKLNIQYFANLRDLSGKEEEVLETTSSQPLELYHELQQRYGFALNTDQLKVAVNDRFVDWEEPFLENDQVTFIPPVEEVEMFRISSIDIDAGPELEKLKEPRAGALVTFEGWVRDHHEGRKVLHLEYQAYEALCIGEADSLKAEVLSSHDVIDLSCVHRVGHCPISTMAVWVGVTAEHRGPAFDACEHYIDALKVRFPIWKKETYVDGTSEWVRCEACASHSHTYSHEGSKVKKDTSIPS